MKIAFISSNSVIPEVEAIDILLKESGFNATEMVVGGHLNGCTYQVRCWAEAKKLPCTAFFPSYEEGKRAKTNAVKRTVSYADAFVIILHKNLRGIKPLLQEAIRQKKKIFTYDHETRSTNSYN